MNGPAGNLQPHIRPTFQRLPTLDAWNATVQRQLNNTTSVELAYIGNKGTNVFAGTGNTYNVNQPSVVGFASGVPQAQRRPTAFLRFSEVANNKQRCGEIEVALKVIGSQGNSCPPAAP